jgi:hypothetical protein
MNIDGVEEKHCEQVFNLMEILSIDMAEANALFIQSGYNFEVF